MAVTQRLDLRVSQSLVMTPQLQQAIKLLQLSSIDLAAYVEQELESNPLLERVDTRDDDLIATDEPDGLPNERVGDVVSLTAAETIPPRQDEPLDADYSNVWTDEAPSQETWSSGGGTDFAGSDQGLEQTVPGTITLREHLISQINVEFRDHTDRLIAMYLVDNLDESGYLRGPVHDAAGDLGCASDQVQRVLDRVQTFDPPGIFARNLAECLAIQQRDHNRLDPAMVALLENLELLGKHDATALMKLCGVDEEDLKDMVAELRTLNPKPALAFDHMVTQPVVPDVLMTPNGSGGWNVELNNDTLPKVLVNTRYYAQVKGQTRDTQERSYLSQHLQAANWLVKALHQRATTILKVSTEIVVQQDMFFRHGIHHLRPLVLRDIAEAVNMHESTISRVTANKYIATPRGMFELRYFFSSAIAGAEGGSHAAEAVRARIKTLIEKEMPSAILSDDRLVEILRGEGIEIARRTVAKYREAMRIPSSVQRRREKKGGSYI